MVLRWKVGIEGGNRRGECVELRGRGRGEYPFWNPYAFAGHPQIADPQSMIFSPPMLALSFVNHSPSLWAIDIAVLAMLLVAGLGVMWLAYDLEWHWAGALVAAIQKVGSSTRLASK